NYGGCSQKDYESCQKLKSSFSLSLSENKDEAFAMEDRKANIVASSSIIALVVFILVARITLKLSPTFFLICGAGVAVILAVFVWLAIRHHYNCRRKLLESKYASEGKELRMEYSFLRKVAGKMGEGKLMEVVDQRLIESGRVDEREVKKLVHIALWCVQERARLRPTMSHVVEMLEGRTPVEEPPDTQMVVVDFLAMDDETNDGNKRAKIGSAALATQEVESNDASTSTCSYGNAMSMIAPR
ncbi:hypothetical protein DVH24_017830, partial [Malus domestica]